MNTTTLMLLRSCARGTQQLALINEIISKRGVISIHEIPYIPLGGGEVRYGSGYGDTKLQSKSYRGLRHRLVESGFTITKYNSKVEIGLGVHSV